MTSCTLLGPASSSRILVSLLASSLRNESMSRSRVLEQQQGTHTQPMIACDWCTTPIPNLSKTKSRIMVLDSRA
eukprot:5150675-Amphidinium_carterae.1